MKKNMELVTLSASFLQWLQTVLRPAAGDREEAEELCQGIQNLLSGSSSTLMVECGDGQSGERSSVSSASLLVCGALRINRKSRSVTRDGKEVSLTPKEYELLAFLAEHRGEIFTKEQIYQAVWNNDYLLDDSNVMAFIRKLRKKIEPNPDSPQYIQTIWGVGYRFCEEPEEP